MAGSQRDMELGNLFGGTRFWLSAQVPQRAQLRQKIQEHGGTVVLQEKNADVMLVDHLKRNLPAGTYSYKYVEASVLNGKLEKLQDYRAGSSSSRPAGASHIARRGTRSDYTLADDQILFDWLYHYEQEEGAPINGNKIYQHIAEKFPQHPFQSWRSRYIKNLRGKGRPGGGEPRSHEEVLALSQVPSIPTEPTPQLQLKPKPSRIPAAARQDQGSKTARPASNASNDPEPTHETVSKRQSLPETATAARTPSEPKLQASRKSQTAPKPTSPKRQAEPKPQAAPISKSQAAPKLQAAPKPQVAPTPLTAPNTMAEPNQSRTSGLDGQHQANERSRKSPSVSTPSKRPHHRSPGSPSHNRGGSGPPTAKRTHIETPETSKTPTSAKSPGQRTSPTDGRQSQTPHVPPTEKQTPVFATADDVMRLLIPPEHLASQLVKFDISDYTLPLPPSSPEQSPEPESDSDVEMGGIDEESSSDVDTWIDAQVKLGAEEAAVLEALQCTSMLPEYAEQALKHYAEKRGMPTNMRGAWTAEDDKGLEGSDSRVMEKLYLKHGEDLVKYRLEYLSIAREE